MRIRFLLAFALIITVTIAIFSYSIQTNTESTITTFAQSGGFVGADRVVNQLSEYYEENGSWNGVMESDLPSPGEPQSQNGSQSNGQGGGQGSGQGSGQGMGMGGGHYGMGSSPGIGMVGDFTLVDADGQVIFTQNLELPANLPLESLTNAIPITANNQTVGYLVPDTTVVDLTDVVSENLSKALSEALAPTAIISATVAIIIALFLGYFLIKPVRQLSVAAQKLGQGDFSQRVPVNGTDELSQLSNTFNHMASTLQQAQESRQAMTADIAHELRTPLSIQRANLEALQDGVYPLNLENLEPIIQQNHLLTQLVEDLRTLALADSEMLTLDLQPINIHNLLTNIYENIKPQFDSASIQFRYSNNGICPDLLIDQRRITQIIHNLLQNARRHTPPSGEVAILVDCGSNSVTVTIKDTGEGIAEDALPQIFERFYRADQSRARDKGGTGLGLTIARQLAEAHQGTLTAANNPEGGAKFTLILPIRKLA